MLKKLWHKLAFAAMVASSVIIGTAAAQASETFSVQEGKALNTNNLFGKIDGQPRMSIWQRNDSDSDQQFDRLPGNRGGILLKHRSTGKCLNAARLWNGAEMNVWNCDANDSDQNWNLVDVGNGFNLIKRTGTNLCVDTPTRNDGGIVHLWDCDSNNGNQRWKSSATNVVQPPNNSPYFHNFEAFVNFVVGRWSIARLDRNDLNGQCVTLIARYIQEVYLSGSQKTQQIAFGNARDTANVVASTFYQYFQPATNQGLPKRGAVISFPDLGYGYGHTAIVMESRTLSNGQRQVRIMDSNGDAKAPNTQVLEYYTRWINIPNGTANGYGNNIYWTNPR